MKKARVMRNDIARLAASLAAAALALSTAPLSAQVISVAAAPIAEIPLGESADFFTFGGGAELSARWAPPSLGGLGLGAGLSYRYLPTRVETGLSAVSLAALASWRLQAGKSLGFEARAGGGGYFATYSGEPGANAYAEASLGADITAGQSFKIGLTAGWSGLLASPRPLYSGLQACISVRFFPGADTKPRLKIDEPSWGPVFPSIAASYASSPLGIVRITNAEGSAVSNVTVSVFAPEVMDGSTVCAEIPKLARGESAEVPIVAILGEAVLAKAEASDAAATITVAYEARGRALAVERSAALRILDRNAISWKEDEVIASFVTPKDPSALKLAKAVAGAVRADSRSGVPLEFRVAVGMAQALKSLGVKYVVDPKSAYSELSGRADSVDFVQYPAQTLAFKAGDCDDLSVLFCTLMESVGVRCAFILVPEHILAAVELPLLPKEAERAFSNPERIISYGGRAYAPVECTVLGSGFMAAWSEGAKQWIKAGGAARLIPVEDAWKSYPSAAVAIDVAAPAMPSDKAIASAYGAEMDKFIDLQLTPLLASLQSDIKKKGATPELENRLGALLGRYGRLDEAERELQKAVKARPFAPAYVNLANVALLRKDTAKALGFFDQARRADPKSALALAGSAACRYDMGDTAEARRLYGILGGMDSAIAGRYAYIAGDGSGRASQGGAATQPSWDD
jgi:tetratricopeptide (TPR) repeat protein